MPFEFSSEFDGFGLSPGASKVPLERGITAAALRAAWSRSHGVTRENLKQRSAAENRATGLSRRRKAEAVGQFALAMRGLLGFSWGRIGLMVHRLHPALIQAANREAQVILDPVGVGDGLAADRWETMLCGVGIRTRELAFIRRRLLERQAGDPVRPLFLVDCLMTQPVIEMAKQPGNEHVDRWLDSDREPFQVAVGLVSAEARTIDSVPLGIEAVTMTLQDDRLAGGASW